MDSRAHDTDSDEFLDGLEIYKSVNHAIQHNPDMQAFNIEDEFRTGFEDQAAIGEAYLHSQHKSQIFMMIGFFCKDLVDEIIEHYDLNNDGKLNMVEFIESLKNEKTALTG